jgi:hypothetical protein
MYCKICNKELNNFRSLCNHLPLHKISILDYYIKYENFEIPKCHCGENCKIKKGLIFYKTCCSDKCIFENRKDKKCSDEMKIKISNSIKLAHSEGRHPGWNHINSDKSRRSYPEKIFYEFLIKNDYFNKYEIVEKFPIGGYFLDFAFIDKKIDLEIDGEQHYRTENIEHDLKRDKYMNDNG